jgi:ADP-Ribosyltransferase in polyvalent proteins
MPDPQSFWRALLGTPQEAVPPPARPATGPAPPPRADSWFDAVVDATLGAVGINDPLDPTGSRASALGGLAAMVPLGKVVRGVRTLGEAKDKLTSLRSALDLSQAARLERAAEQGFDINRRLYHGTQSDFPKFAHGRRGTYLTDRPDIADIYAMTDRGGMTPNAGPNVVPVYIKGKKPLVISDLGPDGGNGWASDNLAAALGVENPGTGTKLYDEARKRGYDYIEVRDMSDLGGRQTQILPLDARSIRSIFAKFDPRNADSANLLASLVGGVGLASLAQPRSSEAR